MNNIYSAYPDLASKTVQWLPMDTAELFEQNKKTKGELLDKLNWNENSFDYKFNSPLNFFLEDKIIKECPYNSNWLIKSYGKEEFNKIKDKIILCSGTVMGTNEKIVEYLNLMIKNIKT